MAAFLHVAVLLSLLVTGTTAGGYSSQTTPSTSTPASYTPTPATPPPSPYTPQPATSPKPAHDYDDDNKLAEVVRVVVEGLLLCQSCAKRGLDGAAPLPKAQVEVTCRDSKDSVMAYRLSVADSNGYFHVEFSVEHADTHMACFVRLRSSPDPKCNMASDILHLRDEGKHWIDGRGLRNVVYAAHPLAFRPQKCAPPHHH